VHLILHPDGALKFERSLPKALTGQNAEDISQDDVLNALAAVDVELGDLTGGLELPPVAEWVPCRVDYCRSHDLEDPGLVDLTLARLARQSVAWKGRPVVGESGSVAWPKGAYRPKFYNKGREDGRPEHRALLRFEVGVFGLGAFRTMPGLLSAVNAPARAGPGLRMVDVLVPAARDHVLSTVLHRMGGLPVNAEDMSDLEFARSMIDYFGARRAAALVGYCSLWAITGVRSAKDLGSDPVTWYRAMADLRRFRDDLAARGRVPEATEDLASWVHDRMGVAA
jgi:hypothetical protein